MLKIIVLLMFISLTSSLTINTKLGQIKGSEKKSRGGRIYYAFTGIPYAKPPLGELRLKNPVKAEAWQGVLDATRLPEPCVQVPLFIHYLRNLTFGTEDCLYLNVYTPKIKNNTKLPILVYIHGGGFRCGSPGPEHSPDYFMDEDVVFISFQYRMGPLGFLSFEDETIPGNFGLKDQVQALLWIKENVEEFGGDSKQITIFGESAGGASTHLHMLSPKTKGLLKGVISQSGVVNQIWSFGRPGTARPLAERVSSKFGCNDKVGTQLLKCLQEVDGKELTRAEIDFLFWDFNPAVVFQPVQEPSSEGAVLDFDPFTLETDLPWIVGIAKEEGNFVRGALMNQDPSVTQEFIDNKKVFLNKLLYIENNTSTDNQKSLQLIMNKYFEEPMTIESVQRGFVDFVTDSYFLFPMYEALRRHKGPVYQYLYNYRAASSLTDILSLNLNLGTNHADEMLILLNWTERHPKVEPRDVIASKNLVKMWANFAKHGIPEVKNIRWPELRSSQGEYLNFSEHPTTDRHLKLDVYKWWINLPMYKTVKAKTEL